MLSSVTSGSTALLLLRQSSAAAVARKSDSNPNNLLSSSVDPSAHRTEAESSATLFSVNSPNPVKELSAMLVRVGHVFGIEPDDYATQSEFVAALGETFAKLTAKPGDPEMIDTIAERLSLDEETVETLKKQKTPDLLAATIEKALGLDRRGVSLTAVIAAGKDPSSSEAEAVYSALLKGLNPAQEPIGWEDLGLYRPGPTAGRTVA